MLLLAQLLPEDGLGLAVRLAAATVCLLVLPGALIMRAIGWPSVQAYALAASIAVSLGVLFVALAITFVVEGSLDLTLGLVAVAALAALVPAAAEAPAAERSEVVVLAAVLGAGVVFAGVVVVRVSTRSAPVTFFPTSAERGSSRRRTRSRRSPW